MQLKPIYKRILLKMSGEALVGDGKNAIDPAVLDRMVADVVSVTKLGVQVALVVGGGNFFRGAALSKVGISRVTGDYMGMLATLMNALALRDAFERLEVPARILSAIEMTGIADQFNCRKAIHHLNEGRVVLFAGGTGNPLFTTDSAASLRGIEINADVVIKATNVDGVYSKDPAQHPSAVLYEHVTFEQVLQEKLAVMDLSAFCQCHEHNMPLRIFNIHKKGALLRVITGEPEGTIVA